MKTIFKNVLLFSVCFFFVVSIDLFLLTDNDFRNYRLITKPLVFVMLIIFYFFNNNDISKKKTNQVFLALSCFLLAGLANYFYKFSWLILTSSILFIAGKLFYLLRFTTKNDFNLKNAIPFLVFFPIYMFVVLNLILDNLGTHLPLILAFLFITLLGILFALLRNRFVPKISFWLVIIGMLLLLSADTISVLTGFYEYWEAEKYVVMLLYAIAQYFIVVGLVKEGRKPKIYEL